MPSALQSDAVIISDSQSVGRIIWLVTQTLVGMSWHASAAIT